MGRSKWRKVQPFTSQADDVARTIVTLWTKADNFSFLAADLEHGPILYAEYGFFVRRTDGPAALLSPPLDLTSHATTAREFIKELKARKLGTIRQRTRVHEEQTWEDAVRAMRGDNLPPHPKPPAGSEPSMRVQVPSERLTAQWNRALGTYGEHAPSRRHIPVFLRSSLNCYAIDILPNDGYTFNEHAVHGPPDKIFEEAAFLERFRNMLVMEAGQNLWLALATPRAWLEQGKKISVKSAPTHFGSVDYEIVSDVPSEDRGHGHDADAMRAERGTAPPAASQGVAN